MNKEEVLKKSQMEHKNMDLYEQEVLANAGQLGAYAAALVCFLFFLIQMLMGAGANYGLWAVFTVIEATIFTYKAAKRKTKHEIMVAVLYWLLTIGFSAAHFYSLSLLIAA